MSRFVRDRRREGDHARGGVALALRARARPARSFRVMASLSPAPARASVVAEASRADARAIRSRAGASGLGRGASFARRVVARARATPSSSASTSGRRLERARGRGREARESTAFERAGGVLYVRNFFDAETSARVRTECERLRSGVTLEHRACAKQRLGMMVPNDNFVHEAFVSKSVADRLRALLLGESATSGELIAGDVPVEYRVYPVGGSMDWHKDVALYTLPQFEIVYTVTNTSDSTTEWEDERTGTRYGGWTEPNSVIIVRADGAPHRVTAVSKGERSIIKFVLTQTLEKTDDFFENLLTYTH